MKLTLIAVALILLGGCAVVPVAPYAEPAPSYYAAPAYGYYTYGTYVRPHHHYGWKHGWKHGHRGGHYRYYK